MSKSILFIISSAITITSNPLCYTARRSAFSAEERAIHTLLTIQSIRAKLPEAKILLIETGLEEALPYNIKNEVDKYLYLGNKTCIRQAADGPFKGLGEAVGLYLANRSILSFDANYYFKLSGRYFLNQHFRIDNWLTDGITGKNYFGGLYTVLYGFPKRLYPNWRSSLKNSVPVLLRAESLEIIQPQYLEKPIHYLDTIGVSGFESHSGNLVVL